MGEQTQAQTQTQIQSPSSSQARADSTSPQQQQPPNPVTDASINANNVSHKKSSNPSKIPIRPRKSRKLSSNPNSTIATITADTSDDGKPLKTIESSSSPSPSPSRSPLPITTSASTSTTTTTTTASTITSTTVNTPTASATKNRRRKGFQSSRVLPQIIKPLSADGEIEAALLHLRVADPLLSALIDTLRPPALESHHSPFLALTRSILYQQLAYKAGTSIYNRFVSLCGGEDAVIPDNVLAFSAQQLKQVGVSGRKASYLYDLANKYKSGILSDDTVVKMDDRSLFTMLSMVKGIGSWSVHMFMIFSLHRPDVLPVSDLGVRKGVQLLYGLEELPKPSQMEQLCEKWRPYRSVGAWYMWRSVEGKGTQNASAAPSLEDANVQPLQQIEPQQDEQQQHQLQLLEPINGMGNLGACIWGQ
ncbi:hypothetical protein ACH5RR_011766 [Cinchona calisaya]|uniref:HhH-GPD domain-containing protein n=1 Tax=Cinchona calisaya TaxID=153742 RepID=A0ABD3A9B7_9GENT